MNDKQKEVLLHHRPFLLRNVVWSDDLANKLLAEGIITDLIMKEIQSSGHGKHDDRKKMAILLDALPFRAISTFTKFCDVLHVNGHPFIADLLRDDEAGNLSDITGVKDIYKRVPVLEKSLKENDKRELESFIIEKAKETSLKASWSKDAVAREKYKVIKAMEKQLEDAFEFEIKEKKKNEEIIKLKEDIAKEKQQVTELRSEIGYIKSQLQNTETKMKNEFGVQMNFSMANENALRKLTDKHDTCTKVLSYIDSKIKGTINTPSRTSERDQMAIVEFPFAFLQTDLDDIVSKYNDLLDIKKHYDALLHERNYILSHLGVHEKDTEKTSLLTAYRDFAVRTDEDLTNLKQQITSNTEVIKGQKHTIDDLHKQVEQHGQVTKTKTAGTAWQNALLNVMRGQLNDVKLENRKKDTKLNLFEGEISRLKARLADMESKRDTQAALVHGPPPGHTHRHSHANTHSQRDMLLNVESIVSRRGSYSNEDNDSGVLVISAVNEIHNRKSLLLPPLEGKLFQSDEVSHRPTQHSTYYHSQLKQSTSKSYPTHVSDYIPIQSHERNSIPHSTDIHSPQKRQKLKPHMSHVPDYRTNILNQDGLITAKLKPESRTIQAPPGGKYGHAMSNRLGDVKNKYAWKAGNL